MHGAFITLTLWHCPNCMYTPDPLHIIMQWKGVENIQSCTARNDKLQTMTQKYTGRVTSLRKDRTTLTEWHLTLTDECWWPIITLTDECWCPIITQTDECGRTIITLTDECGWTINTAQ